jgi:dynein heavy chain
LDVINEILPKIAKAKTDGLKSEAQDATVKLETKPETTLDFVDSLTFLDEIQERMDPLEQESEIVRQMYELIEQYRVPCPPEDIVSYSSLTTTLNGCRNAMDKALTERDSNVTKFVSLLDKDIEILTQEVRQIKQDSQNPLLLDPTADKDKVKLLLDDYLRKIDSQQRTSGQYRLYQKNFKVEVTKFDELEEVYGELKLKELLWNSQNEWDVLLEDVKNLDFNKLDHEQLTGTVNKYGKYVYQLERGLPPNQLVPILKEKVESLRGKVCEEEKTSFIRIGIFCFSYRPLLIFEIQIFVVVIGMLLKI